MRPVLIAEICSVDTVTVLESDLRPGATCGLGEFQPVTIAPVAHRRLAHP